jgi:hypothetical protein
VTVLLSLLPINPANTFVMRNSTQISFQLPYLPGEQLLIIHGYLFVGGRNIVTDNIAHKGSQYFDYLLLSLHSAWIMQDARQ